MIRSMTAFARESMATGCGVLTVELRSVNHRYLDCSFKMPDLLRPMESGLREAVAKGVARGKLECLVRLHVEAGEGAELRINPRNLERLLAATTEVARQVGESKPLDPLQVLQFPGVCDAPRESEEELQREAGELFDRALEILCQNREREGGKLAALILERLLQVEREVAATRKRLPELRQRQRERILARIEELGIEVDHNRLEQELVHLAQKMDVDEELDRLDAHVGEVRRALEKGGPCGRRLDFLMQELNREANTLSSKSVSAGTTQSAVELKVLIEQMREQIQNIE